MLVRTSHPLERRAVSLLELLIVIAAVTILIATALPSLRVFRQKSWEVASVANARQHAAVFAAYTVDYAGTLPYLTKRDATLTVVRVGGRAYGIKYFAAKHWWNLILAGRYYDGQSSCPCYFSPADLAETPPFPYGFDTADYRYTATALADPVFWSSASRTGPEQWGPQRIDRVKFTSKKGLFLEQPAHWSASWNRGDEFRHAVSFFDGHAEAHRLRDLLAPVVHGEGNWPGSESNSGDPVVHTRDGLRGRDVQ